MTDASNGDLRGDRDEDVRTEKTEHFIDQDDAAITGFGRPASPAEATEISALVRRFLGYARAGDGAAACRLEYSIFREAIPEDYGNKPSMPFAKGKTCAAIMTKVFRHDHHETLANFRIADVLVKGASGYALLGSKSQPPSYINLERERGKWTIVGLLFSPLP